MKPVMTKQSNAHCPQANMEALNTQVDDPLLPFLQLKNIFNLLVL